MNIFPNKLKRYRKFKKLTQNELAAILEVTRGTIANYESGVSFPHYDIIMKLCDILDCTPNDLLLNGSEKEYINPDEGFIDIKKKIKSDPEKIDYYISEYIYPKK